MRRMQRARWRECTSSSTAPRRHSGVRVAEEDGAITVELHVALDWGAARPRSARVQERVAEYLDADGELPSVTVDVVIAGVAVHGRLMRAAASRASPRGTIALRPLRVPRLRLVAVPGNRTASKERWMERAEEDWGEWGTIYLDEGGRLLGSMQYGPSHLFPRAADLPAGPAVRGRGARDVLLPRRGTARNGSRSRCSSRRSASHATGREGARGVRVPLSGGESVEERFLVHRTVFPRDFLDEFGFVTVRAQGRVELCRLELGGLVPGRGGEAGEGAARRPGGVHAGPCPGPGSLIAIAR